MCEKTDPLSQYSDKKYCIFFRYNPPRNNVKLSKDLSFCKFANEGSNCTIEMYVNEISIDQKNTSQDINDIFIS